MTSKIGCAHSFALRRWREDPNGEKGKKTKAGAEADVESYRHEEAKRKNIPTAENQKLIADEDKAIRKLRWKRNLDLDPQLVWRGKDFESDPLEVDAPPSTSRRRFNRGDHRGFRRQTRAAARTVLRNSISSRTSTDSGRLEGGCHRELLPRRGHWQNRMILGDSLLVMASLSEREGLRGKVQCIYMDPPYGIRFNSNWQPSTKSTEVKDTGVKNISREPEVIRAFRDTWKDGINSYLSYLRDRFVVARGLLHESGSIFVQIGDENVHRVRAALDEVFGEKNFVSLISLQKTGGQEATFIPNVSDYIVWFAKNADAAKYRQIYFKKQLGIGEGSGQRYDRVQTEIGFRRALSAEEKSGSSELPASARPYQLTSLISSGIRTNTTAEWTFRSERFHSGATSNWKTSLKGLDTLAKADRIEARATTVAYVRFIDDFPAYPMSNIWTDVAGAVGKTYVVQTSATIVQRCILMADNPGDLILDPTCGSGTTAYVAEQWGRRWITIDFQPQWR